MRTPTSLLGMACLLASLSACDGDGHTHMHGESCQAIIDVCHDVDPGSGPIHDCHETGHASDEEACEPIQADCVAMCTAAAADGGGHHDGGAHDHDGGH